MTLRAVEYELEAKLKGDGSFFSKPGGKVERKSYSDGSERLKISLRKLKASEGSFATVKIGGSEVAQLKIEKGSARFDEESTELSAMPKMKAGQSVEVLVDGALVLQGTLNVD